LRQTLLFALIIALNASCCDICVSYFGFNPNFYQNRIGINYSYLSSVGAHTHTNEAIAHGHENNDIEVFTRYELDGLFFLGNGDQIIFKVPFVDNYSLMNQLKGNRNIGLGDPLFIYQKELKVFNDSINKYRWYLGIGAELPLGSFDINFVDPRMELGSGSIDAIITSSLLIKQNWYGASINGIYKYNTNNASQYQFGQQVNLSADIFIYTNQDYYIPYLGVFQEYGLRDRYQNEVQDNTGGQIHYLNFGHQFFYKNLSINYVLQTPIYQRLNGHQATSNFKHIINLYYYLN